MRYSVERGGISETQEEVSEIVKGFWALYDKRTAASQFLYDLSQYSIVASVLAELEVREQAWLESQADPKPTESSPKPRSRGIDLGAKSNRKGVTYKADEVRKLLFAGFAGKLKAGGYDPEDVLQEVYRGLLVRNNGKCPFEEGKGTFGHYVHMVIHGVLTNYHRKQTRRKESPMDFDQDEGDFGQWGHVEMGYGTSGQDDRLKIELREFLKGTKDGVRAQRVLDLVSQGYRRKEIVARTGMSESEVSKALSALREGAKAWAQREGIGSSFFKCP